MDSVVLQLCYDDWWETLADGRMEYVNAKNTAFLVWKDCTFDQFLVWVYEVLQINPNEYSMQILGKFFVRPCDRMEYTMLHLICLVASFEMVYYIPKMDTCNSNYEFRKISKI